MRSFRIVMMVGLAALPLLYLGCSADKPAAPTATSIYPDRPTTVGALGDSYTAGFMNGGLIDGGQVAGFAHLIALQLEVEQFEQPLIKSPGIGSELGPGDIPLSALFVNPSGEITRVPVDPFALLDNARHPVPYDNMGVPGSATTDLLNATDAASSLGDVPFFDLVLRNSALPPGTTTQFDQIRSIRPALLVVWTGVTDVLNAAAGGDPVVGQNITPSVVWGVQFKQMLDSVATIGSEIVALGNVPGISTMPYFTTVPLGNEIPNIGLVPWQTEEADVKYVLLPAGQILDGSYLPPPIGTGTNALPSDMTLTESEASAVETQIDAYNAIIVREATQRGYAFGNVFFALGSLCFDCDALNQDFGWSELGQNVNSAYSLDGIHTSEKGYGLLANTFIKAINDLYGTSIPLVDIDKLENKTGFEQAPSGFAPPHHEDQVD